MGQALTVRMATDRFLLDVRLCHFGIHPTEHPTSCGLLQTSVILLSSRVTVKPLVAASSSPKGKQIAHASPQDLSKASLTRHPGYSGGRMKSWLVMLVLVAGAGLFESGYATGQGRFGQPRTVIHVVSVRWTPGVSDTDKVNVLEGVKKMAASIPGVR